MTSVDEFYKMSGRQQTAYLEKNHPANKISASARKTVRGVGVNDAGYCQQPKLNGLPIVCPAYSAWIHMLGRAYGSNYHMKRPTYHGVTVCSEWHSFMAFRGWWLEHQVDGWDLDKDLLSDNKIYSPETCIFVPAWINSFTLGRSAARGDWPIGVCFRKGSGMFLATCKNPITKKQEHIGLFDTPIKAHQAWRERKIELAIMIKPETDKIDKRIHYGILRIIKGAI